MLNKSKCLCGNPTNNAKFITNEIRFGKKANVIQCNKCSLIYLDKDSFTLPSDFYEAEYHQTYLTHVEPDALNPDKYYQKMLKSTKIWADRMKNILNGSEVVLDVGCSTGHFIKLIESKAKTVFGHEISKKEVQFCKDKLGLNVDSIPLSERFEKNTFDYITLIFVLEHIDNPIQFLKDLSQFLKPSGKIIILVPNANDALINLYNIPKFNEFYYCIEHLYYYTPETINMVFEKVGLSGKIKTLQEYPITNHLNWGYREKPSDVLKSRKEIPDISIMDENLEIKWETFWKDTNNRYKKFLNTQGYGDRIWCEVGF